MADVTFTHGLIERRIQIASVDLPDLKSALRGERDRALIGSSLSLFEDVDAAAAVAMGDLERASPGA